MSPEVFLRDDAGSPPEKEREDQESDETEIEDQESDKDALPCTQVCIHQRV